ncbi:hypothetical protein [Roseivirga sp. E12]|uniref:hypothetical protein n=1 Tax=Roseivirga sp. E12 TaxID=2819237 RepID=UPI001ABBF310|nr:hypothetical protein [Roseivirga sp. E12]MBO3700797.1 hypothetical protein [Roseivirga sp. E12]
MTKGWLDYILYICRVMEEMSFDDYLVKKKIDPKAFAKGQSKRFEEFKNLFDQVHPDSFTAQKLFLINKTRRTYPLGEVEVEKTAKKPMMKPKIARPKTN